MGLLDKYSMKPELKQLYQHKNRLENAKINTNAYNIFILDQFARQK